MQAVRPVIFCESQKAMAPAKTGVAMNAQLLCGRAHGKGMKHAIRIRQSARFITQVCQQRAAQGIEGPAAGYAAITLQTMRMAMAAKMARLAGRAMQLRLRRLFDQAFTVNRAIFNACLNACKASPQQIG